MSYFRRLLACAIGIAIAATTPARAEEPLPDRIQFNRDIRPILSDNCYACHGFDSKKRKADLRLDTKAGLSHKLVEGLPVAPGKPAESLVYQRVATNDPDDIMPPPESKRTLSARQKALLKKWIEQGAAWEDHWAYMPVARPPVPAVENDWVRNQVDQFIFDRLQKEGLKPAKEADKATLIRRVTLDLTGLPPTPKEVDNFLADPSADAYENVVDRLLGSVRYGERMAMEWLDAARFADTHGYHIDAGRDMTRWREWVIEAFYRNKPYDQFTVEQLAGDLLPNATLEQKIASGFNRNHMVNFEGGAIAEEYRTAYVLDRVNTTGTIWLGMTVACTQCHDHKFDPITQKEYFQLYAFFNNIDEKGLDGSKGNAAPFVTMASTEQQKKLDEFASQIAGLEKELAAPNEEADAAQTKWEAAQQTDAKSAAKGKLPLDVQAALQVATEKRSKQQQQTLQNHFRRTVWQGGKKTADKLAAIQKEQAAFQQSIPTSMVMQELAKPRDTFVLQRGEYDKPGEKVMPGLPAFLPPLPNGEPANRLGLARWLVDRQHPLTSRVTVNRYWQVIFGTGLVKTLEDFGSQGELPSHPELLDWLAADFMETGWDVRRLIRLYITSATYRQHSAVSPQMLAKDPENRLLARGTRHRLQAEMIRDQALAAAGLLDSRVGGASVSPYQPPGLWEELMSRGDGAKWSAQVYVQSKGPDLYRRTMYTFWKRTSPPPTLSTFDAPDREVCTVRRGRTNTPLQALVLMNDPTYVEAARKLAERVMTEPPAKASDEDRISFAFKTVLARPATEKEIAILATVLEKQRAKFARNPQDAMKMMSVGESPRNEKLNMAEAAAWTNVCSVIFNLDEAVTRG